MSRMDDARSNVHQVNALRIWNAAIQSVHPNVLLREHLHVTESHLLIGDKQIPLREINKVYVAGAGKASAAMAAEAERILGNILTDGLITVKHGHALTCEKINVIEASHPTPDASSVFAITQTLELLQKATEDDLVILLLSGGASSLWCDVPEGLSIEQLNSTYDILINSGASIQEVNTVRKHLSLIKGGQLVKYCKARIFSLIISDVPGDDLNVIGGAPTYPDTSTFYDALAVIQKYNLKDYIPDAVLSYLQRGLSGLIAETLKPHDRHFNKVDVLLIGSNQIAVNSAIKEAEKLGYHTYPANRLITGDTEKEAQNLVHKLLSNTYQKPFCIVQGGETVIKVTGDGKGGRNQHFALAALSELRSIYASLDVKELILLSCGTDGTDGPTDAAGAIINLEMVKKDLNLEPYLKNHDSYSFFSNTGSLIKTGPTQTNVMDIQIMIVV